MVCYHVVLTDKDTETNKTHTYYSPPLVGNSHEEDTITTHFDWKK